MTFVNEESHPKIGNVVCCTNAVFGMAKLRECTFYQVESVMDFLSISIPNIIEGNLTGEEAGKKIKPFYQPSSRF